MSSSFCDLEFGKEMRSASDFALNECGFDLLSQYRAAVQISDIDKNVDVLDVATGSGRMAYVLAWFGIDRVVSGDISRDVIEAARVRIPENMSRHIEFKEFDAGKMPFEDDSFGVVVCAQGMHEMENPEQVMNELARVCAPDGQILIIDFNLEGFDLIDRIHQNMGRPPHYRGKAGAANIYQWVCDRFADVRFVDFPINNVWIAKSKKNARCYLSESV